MSWHPSEDAVCDATDTCDFVKLVIRPKEHDIGGLTVRRSLPVKECPMVGPFIFFDQMGPAVVPADAPINVRPHPHIGLATLTWLVEGAIMHRDSLGYAQEIHPGEVNWMTAGRGIVHSERTPEHLLGKAQSLSGLQVWMALPRDHEETEPSFQHYKAADIPCFSCEGVRAVVVAGTAWGVTSPVSVYSETLYVDVRMEAGADVEIEARHEERAVYLLSGQVRIGNDRYTPGEMIVLRPGPSVPVVASEDTHLVIIGGAPMDGPRIKWWNLVSSRRDLIDRAKRDWKEGKFPKVPGDEDEFIPLPTLSVHPA